MMATTLVTSQLPQPIAREHVLSQRSRWLREYGLSLVEQLRSTHPAMANALLCHLNVLRRRIRSAIETGNHEELRLFLNELDDRLEPAELVLRDEILALYTRHHAA